MNPFKKSVVGSVLVLTSILMYYNHYLSNGVFEIFSEASVFLVLGALEFILSMVKSIVIIKMKLMKRSKKLFLYLINY